MYTGVRVGIVSAIGVRALGWPSGAQAQNSGGRRVVFETVMGVQDDVDHQLGALLIWASRWW